MPKPSSSRIYVGNLPEDVRESELEAVFSKFGRICDIDIKYGRTSNGTAYAFLEYDSLRDAEDAVDARDGYKFGGTRLRVEFTGERRPRRQQYSSGPPKRSEFRVVVSGLPKSASWQDLKDHMRSAGTVGYANVQGSQGVVEYEDEEDMLYAIRKLDKSEFRNPFHRAMIRVRAETGSSPHRSSESYRGRSRSRSRRRPERPRSLSGHVSDKVRSRSRHSRSPRRNRSRSPRVSRSRSPTVDGAAKQPRIARSRSASGDRRKPPRASRSRSPSGDRRKPLRASRSRSPSGDRRKPPRASRSRSPSGDRRKPPRASRSRSPSGDSRRPSRAMRSTSPKLLRSSRSGSPSPKPSRSKSPSADGSKPLSPRVSRSRSTSAERQTLEKPVGSPRMNHVVEHTVPTLVKADE